MNKTEQQQQIISSIQPLIRLLRHRLIKINYWSKKNIFLANCKHCDWELKIIGSCIFAERHYLTTYYKGVVGRVNRGKFNEHICPKVAVML